MKAPIEDRSHITGFREHISKAAGASRGEFFGWFDAAETPEESFVRGSWDFAYHIAAPALPYLACPHTLTALEIGYGGGRILASAARSFGTVIGVDIHDHAKIVEAELAKLGLTNFQLARGEGAELPVESASIDFVYSFIVMQHVEKLRIFESYLRETSRVLKHGGVAVIYYGRVGRLSEGSRSALRWGLDRLIAPIYLWPKGFRELPAAVNATNLIIAPGRAKRSAQAAGLDVARTVTSRKRVPDGYPRYGGQHGLVLRKPG